MPETNKYSSEVFIVAQQSVVTVFEWPPTFLFSPIMTRVNLCLSFSSLFPNQRRGRKFFCFFYSRLRVDFDCSGCPSLLFISVDTLDVMLGHRHHEAPACSKCIRKSVRQPGGTEKFALIFGGCLHCGHTHPRGCLGELLAVFERKRLL